jgi:hypothetical protein
MGNTEGTARGERYDLILDAVGKRKSAAVSQHLPPPTPAQVGPVLQMTLRNLGLDEGAVSRHCRMDLLRSN